MELAIGKSETEQVKLSVFGYKLDATGIYYDDNCLDCYVELKFGGFTGAFEASFLTSELIALLPQLEELYKTLEGSASFTSMEHQLEFTITGNGLGSFEIEGEAMDEAGPANLLKFYSDFDQTFLPRVIRQLTAIVNEYPERS